tara:strand:- start:62 stop:382 length:321 start_codon:yes stop_codon:yes gene_type:complete
MSKYSPAHYQQGSIQVWDFIVDQQLGYLEGNIVKYITRAGKKDNESRLDDLLKAQAYIHKAVSTELNNAIPTTRPDGSSDPVSESYVPAYCDGECCRPHIAAESDS